MHLTVIPDHTQGSCRSFAGMSASPSSPARLPGGVRPRANMHGTTWRGAAEGDRSDPDAAKTGTLMLARPALVERPVIDDRETARIGPRQVRIVRGFPGSALLHHIDCFPCVSVPCRPIALYMSASRTPDANRIIGGGLAGIGVWDTINAALPDPDGLDSGQEIGEII